MDIFKIAFPIMQNSNPVLQSALSVGVMADLGQFVPTFGWSSLHRGWASCAVAKLSEK